MLLEQPQEVLLRPRENPKGSVVFYDIVKIAIVLLHETLCENPHRIVVNIDLIDQRRKNPPDLVLLLSIEKTIDVDHVLPPPYLLLLGEFLLGKNHLICGFLLLPCLIIPSYLIVRFLNNDSRLYLLLLLLLLNFLHKLLLNLERLLRFLFYFLRLGKLLRLLSELIYLL